VALPLSLKQAALAAAVAVLAIPGAADAKTHRFAPASEVSVSFQIPKGKATGTLIRFGRNRVSVIRSRNGVLTLRVPGRRARHIALRRHSGKRVVVALSTIRMRAKLSVSPAAAAIAKRFVAEDAVAVNHGIERVRIRTARRRAPAADTSSATSAPSSTPSVPRLFAPDSAWNAPLPANAPLDPANATLVSTFRAAVAQNMAAAWGPWISTGQTTSLYVVPADQPTVRVALDPGTWKAGLQQTFDAVPIPANAEPGDGPDAHMTIWQPSTDRLWETWLTRKSADGWHASFGGAMANVSSSPGYFDADSWPGLSQAWWGATATSLPAIAGTMMISELKAGVIPHALAIAIPTARAKTYSLPAQRTDGSSTDPRSIPEGARFRLDPKLDLTRLDLPPVTRAMAVAAQRYGMIVRDVTGHAISFFAENPDPSGTNPYPALYGSEYPNAVMKAFPWDRLQLVKMDLRTMK
jgi:hypothetical protein